MARRGTLGSIPRVQAPKHDYGVSNFSGAATHYRLHTRARIALTTYQAMTDVLAGRRTQRGDKHVNDITTFPPTLVLRLGQRRTGRSRAHLQSLGLPLPFLPSRGTPLFLPLRVSNSTTFPCALPAAAQPPPTLFLHTPAASTLPFTTSTLPPPRCHAIYRLSTHHTLFTAHAHTYHTPHTLTYPPVHHLPTCSPRHHLLQHAFYATGLDCQYGGSRHLLRR